MDDVIFARPACGVDGVGELGVAQLERSTSQAGPASVDGGQQFGLGGYFLS